MLILLCILCVVLYTRQQREGFFKKMKRGFKKHVSAPVASSFRSVKRHFGYKSPAQLAKEARDRLAKIACDAAEQSFIASSAARATEQAKIDDLTKISRDPNFNIDAYNYLNEKLFLLRTALDENTEKNNDLKNTLDATVGYQTTSVSLLSKLEKDRARLTECNINHSLSNQDYDVLT